MRNPNHSPLIRSTSSLHTFAESGDAAESAFATASGAPRSTRSSVRRLTLGALFGLSLLTACGDSEEVKPTEETVDEALAEACEHMDEGPFVDVTAGAATDAELEDVALEHTAVRIALPATDDGFGGLVDFASDEEGEVALFFSSAVNLEAFDATGQSIEIEPHSVEGGCDEVTTAFHVDMAVGTTTLMISSTTDATVTLVHEREDEDHDHADEDHEDEDHADEDHEDQDHEDH